MNRGNRGRYYQKRNQPSNQDNRNVEDSNSYNNNQNYPNNNKRKNYPNNRGTNTSPQANPNPKGLRKNTPATATTQIFVQKKKTTSEEEKQETPEQKKLLSEEEQRKKKLIEEKKRKEEEERQRIEEEKRKKEEEERQRIEEEKRKKEEEEEEKKYQEGKKKYEDQKKIRLEKQKLRLANLKYQDKKRLDENQISQLENNIKKNTSFIKKLKPISEEQKDSLLKDLSKLNLKKYISEIATAIVDYKVKPSDLNCAILVCSEIHQIYVDFDSFLLERFLTILKTKEDPKVFAKLSDSEKSQKFILKRSLLRLMTELYSVGFWIKKGISGTFGKFFLEMLNNFEADIRDGNYFEMTNIVHFLRWTGEEIFGIPTAFHKKYYEEDPNKIDPIHEGLITQQEKENFEKAISTYYQRVSDLLLKAFKAIKEKEKQHKHLMETKGEIPQKNLETLEKMTKAYEKVDTNLKSLSELLAKDLPKLPKEEEEKTEREDISLVQFQQSSTDRSSDSPFDDEDTRAFYQDLPDLIAQLPMGLLGKKRKPETNDKKEDKKEDSENKIKENSKKEEVNSDKQENTVSTDKKEEEETKLLDEDENINEDEDKDENNPSGTISELVSKLPECVNRDAIDNLSLQFCYLNSKKAKKRLIDELFQVPRTKLVLIPYYSRMVANLNQVGLKDIGLTLVQKLESEFSWILYKKDQLNIENKIKNIRYLSELVKFEICPPKDIFNIWVKLMNDFVNHNIDVLCTLIECCGRFLYKKFEVKTKNLLEIMIKKKETAIHMDPRRATAIANAFYTCIPPERKVSQKPELPPLFKYIEKLIFVDLKKENTTEISTQLAKLPWKEDDSKFILKTFLKLHKGKFENIELVAHLIQTLLKNATLIQEALSIKLVDRLIEDIIQGLETNDFSKQQRMIMKVKFLGELYNYYIIEESNVIFDTLGLILNYGHRPPKFPPNASQNFIKFIQKQFSDHQQFLDPPNDYFRIRLICTLLDTCAKFFETGILKTKLHYFIAYFQRYILSKRKPPMDIEFMISDTFENLPIDVNRFETLSEICLEIDQMEQEKKYIPLKFNHQKKKRIIHNFAPTFDSNLNPLETLFSNDQNNQSNTKEEEEEIFDEKDDDEEEDDDDEDEDEEDEDSKENDDEEDDEEDDDEESKEEEDPEFTQVQFKHKPTQEQQEKTEDSDELDQLLNQMIKESTDTRKQEIKYTGQRVDLTIPLNLMKGNIPEVKDADFVGVKMLVKKGSRPATKDLKIPNQSKLIQNQKKNIEDEIQERKEINRIVLQYEENEREREARENEKEEVEEPKKIVESLFKPKPREYQPHTFFRGNIRKKG